MNTQKFNTGAQRDTQTGKKQYTLVENIELAVLREKANAYEMARFDTTLIDPDWMNSVTGVLQNGTSKYGRDNWRKGIPFIRCIGSLYRHIAAFLAGEQDEDHLANASCNLMFLHWYDAQVRAGKLPAELDDRPAPWAEARPLPARLKIGSWEWSKSQMERGLSVTNPCYRNFSPLCRVYMKDPGAVTCTCGITTTDSMGIRHNDWELYYKEGSSRWALEHLKAGREISKNNSIRRGSDPIYYWKNGKVVFDAGGTTYPSCNGPGGTDDEGYEQWEVVS